MKAKETSAPRKDSDVSSEEIQGTSPSKTIGEDGVHSKVRNLGNKEGTDA